MDHLIADYLIRGAQLWLSGEKLKYRLRENCSTDSLLTELTANKPAILAALQSDSRKRRWPVTDNQRALYLHQALNPEDSSYNVLLSTPIPADCDIASVERALQQLIARHISLCRVYEQVGEHVYQFVAEDPNAVRVTVDSSLQAVANVVKRPFALDGSPLIRAVLTPSSEGEGDTLTIVMHHLNVDFWSLGLIATDLLQALSGKVISPLEDGYLTHVSERHLNPPSAEKRLFWTNEIQTLYSPFSLPQVALDAEAGSSAAFYFSLNDAQKERLARAGRRFGVSSFIVMLGAYFLLLRRIAGSNTISVCVPTFGRQASETETVGYYVNPLPMLLKIDPADSIRDMLAVLKDKIMRGLDDGQIPYSEIVRLARGVAGDTAQPPFPVFFNWNALPSKPGLQEMMRDIKLEQVGGFCSLMLTVTELRDGLKAAWNYDSRCAPFIERWHAYFLEILDDVLSLSDARIADVSPLPSMDVARLGRYNDTAVDFGRPRTLVDKIVKQARKTPEALAVKFGSQQLSYEDLDRASLAVAAQLQGRGVAPGSFVGVCLDRSIELIVALIAIQRAGAAFVPLDISYPQQRLEQMIVDAGLRLVVVGPIGKEVTALHSCELLAIEDAETLIAGGCVVDINNFEVTSAAYMLYTSGSTGVPKGVIIEHEAIYNRLCWMQREYRITPGDRVLQKTPSSFDVSVWEFFWPLMFGATLVLARPEGHKDPSYLRELIEEEGITHVHFVPSMLQIYLEYHDGPVSHCLKNVYCSGEALPPGTVAEFFALYPAVRLHNLYGPTEAAVDVSYFECRPGDAERTNIPIGRPVANTRLHVLDANLCQIPIGSTGELYIEGVQLARHYHQREELNSERFIYASLYGETAPVRLYKTGDVARWALDGHLEYLGRTDFQVKIRGQRVELGDIEVALRSHRQVSSGVVLIDHRRESPAILAFVLLKGEAPVPESLQSIRETLVARLPLHMIPAHIEPIAELPVTPNGKLDRVALLAQVSTSGSDVKTGADRIDPALEKVWATVLNNSQSCSADANFFFNGGDSIKALRLIAEMKSLGYSLSAQDLYRNPTLGSLNYWLSTQSTNFFAIEPVLPFSLLDLSNPLRGDPALSDAFPLTTLQEVMYTHSLLNPEVPIYHDVFSIHLTKAFPAELFEEVLFGLTQAHPLLRAHLAVDSDSLAVKVPHRASPDFCMYTVPGAMDFQSFLREREAQEKASRFDFEQGPLIRFRYITDGQNNVLLVCFHHLILDGWSVASLIQSLCSSLLIGQFIQKPEGGPGFADYVALERKSLVDIASQRYWTELLSQVPPTILGDQLELQKIAPDSVIEHRWIDIQPEVEKSLRAVAERFGVPLKTLCLAMHCQTLMIFLDSTQIVSTYVVDGRPEGLDYETVLGLHLNSLPIVAKKTASLETFVRDVFKSEVEAIAHRRYPMQKMAKEIVGKRFVNSVFNFTHFHVYQSDPSIRDLISDITVHEFTDFDFVSSFSINPRTNSLSLRVDCRQDVLRAHELDCVMDIYQAVVSWFARSAVEPNSLAPANPRLARLEANREQVLEFIRQYPGIKSARFAGTDGHGRHVVDITRADLHRSLEFPVDAPHLLRHRLPNGMDIACLNRSEADFNYREVFLDGLMVRYDLNLPEGAVVFDIGANIGLFSLFIQHHFPSARIYAFEPISPVFAALAVNVKALQDSSTLICKALSDRRGTAEFSFYENNTLLSGFYSDEQDVDTSVQAVLNAHGNPVAIPGDGVPALKDYLAARLTREMVPVELSTVSDEIRRAGLKRIDLLKIDVEKAELDVLRGIEAEHWPCIQAVYMEIHDIDGRLETIRSWLDKEGLSIRVEQDELLSQTNIFSLIGSRRGPRAYTEPLRSQVIMDDSLIESVVKHLESVLPGVAQGLSLRIASAHAKVDFSIVLNAPGVLKATTDDQQTFRALWRDLFKSDLTDPDLSLYQLGVDSIAVLRLLRNVNLAFGTRIPVAALSTDLSPNGLLALRHLHEDERWITVHSQHADKPTVVFITPFATSPEVYRPLLQSMREAFSLITITLSDHAYRSVDLMVVASEQIEALVPTLRAADLLVGWSLGGNLALALAVCFKAHSGLDLPVATIDSFLLADEFKWPDADVVLAQGRDDPFALERRELLASLRVTERLPLGLHFRASKLEIPDGVGVYSASSAYENRLLVEVDAGHFDILSDAHCECLAESIQKFLNLASGSSEFSEKGFLHE